MPQTIEVRTTARVQLVNITAQVQRLVGAAGLRQGFCLVFVPHTTAGVTINENADPDVVRDMIMALERAVPDGLPYRHAEGNSPAHVKASLVGPSVVVPVEDGALVLGTWQAVFFCEFDGPRRRQAHISLVGPAS